jgi:hypothetical protein
MGLFVEGSQLRGSWAGSNDIAISKGRYGFKVQSAAPQYHAVRKIGQGAGWGALANCEKIWREGKLSTDNSNPKLT